MYCNKFFKTEEEAKAFKKSHGGALYKNIKGSHTRQAYRVEAMMAVQGGWSFPRWFLAGLNGPAFFKNRKNPFGFLGYVRFFGFDGFDGFCEMQNNR